MKPLRNDKHFVTNVYIVRGVTFDLEKRLVPSRIGLWKENARVLERKDCPGVYVDIEDEKERDITFFGNNIGDLLTSWNDLKEVSNWEFWNGTCQESEKVMQKM